MYKKAVYAVEKNTDSLKGIRNAGVKGRFEQTVKEAKELGKLLFFPFFSE